MGSQFLRLIIKRVDITAPIFTALIGHIIERIVVIAVTAVIVILLATGIHNVGTDLVVHFNNRGGPIGKSIGDFHFCFLSACCGWAKETEWPGAGSQIPV